MDRREVLRDAALAIGSLVVGAAITRSSPWGNLVHAEVAPTPPKKEKQPPGSFKVYLPLIVKSQEVIRGGMTNAEGSLAQDCQNFHRVAAWVESLPETANCEVIPMFRRYTQAEIAAFVPTLAGKGYIHKFLFGNEPNVAGQDSPKPIKGVVPAVGQAPVEVVPIIRKTSIEVAQAVKWFDDAMVTTRPDINVYYMGLGFAGAGLDYLRAVVGYWDNNPQYKPGRRINLNFHMYPCNASAASDCVAPLFKYFPDRKNLTLYKQQFRDIVAYVRSRPDIFSNRIMVSETGVITDSNWDTQETIAAFLTQVKDFYVNEISPELMAANMHLDGVFLYTDFDTTYYPLMSAYTYNPSTGKFILNPIGNAWLPFAGQ